jgi:hypothetical protein
MTTLSTVSRLMKEFNASVAPGSECAAWGDFVNDCKEHYGVMPWSDEAEEIEPSQNFVEFWLAVSNNETPDGGPYYYDKDGSRLE